MREFPGKKKEAILTVVMDRLIGMAALVLTALLTTVLRWQWLQRTPQATVLLWVLISMLIGFVLITIGSFAVTGFKLVDRLPDIFRFVIAWRKPPRLIIYLPGPRNRCYSLFYFLFPSCFLFTARFIARPGRWGRGYRSWICALSCRS